MINIYIDEKRYNYEKNIFYLFFFILFFKKLGIIVNHNIVIYAINVNKNFFFFFFFFLFF